MERRAGTSSETSLPDTVTAETRHYTFSKSTECVTPRTEHNVSYGVWVTMMRQCMFISVTNGVGC